MERETDFRVTMIGEKNFPWFERFLNEKPSGEQAGLGLIMDDRACGAAVFSIEDAVCTLHYLFIPEEERRKGGASFLLHSAMEAMRDYQVSEMMVCYSPDEGLEAFLAKMGFVCAPSLTLRSFKAVDLIDSPECRKSIARLKMEGVIPFASLSRKHRLEWAALASEQGFSPELTEDGRFDQKLSFAILEDRSVTGALLADRKKDGSANAFYVTELLYTGAKQ